MKLFQINSLKDLLIHLSVMIGSLLIVLLFFFYLYLPSATNHGETLTVPNLIGMPLDELDEFLTERDMRFEVNPDSSYSAEYPPLAVLKQFPKAGSKVKENRKIYLSLNATTPPKVKMPKLIDGSLKNAQLVLQSYGLILGDIRYVPHQFQNAVLEQKYSGKDIAEGDFIPKGSKIDLIVGDGLGKSFAIPNVIGMDQEDASFILAGSGLKIKKTSTEISSQMEPGLVLRQFPPAGQSVKVGDYIELVIAEADASAEDVIVGDLDAEDD
ncbi:PASTA domain-containing protein [Cytophagales bacterium LB-30]|uniref:PASTA domain-containing protein n=1 Tax=Shiella aurantiaca TaxID=3058365 RepID=A0ABT8F429_9BACT|nr:PASTA domain-containing protein [Shiella aurantiaca]MDN4165223.1 PASTA domain-containing protein [Shiella aurantiaca]